MRSNPQLSSDLPVKALVLIVLTCLFWGGSIPTIKVSEFGIPPLLNATGRSALGALLVMIYARRKGYSNLMRGPNFWHGVIIGQFFGLTMLCLYLGLVLTDAARGAIFYSTKPFWAALGAHFLLTNDRLSVVKVLGLLLALLGTYLALISNVKTMGGSHWTGDFLEILGALFFTATAIYAKWLSGDAKITPFHTLFAMLLFSIPLLAVSTVFFEWHYPIRLSSGDLLAFAYQALLAGFLAYLLWFWLIHQYSVSRLASFTFLVPLLGVILSAIFLGDPIPPVLWVGLALNVCGIYLVNRPADAAKPG